MEDLKKHNYRLSEKLENKTVDLQSLNPNVQQQIKVLNKAAIVSITNEMGEIIYCNEKFAEISKYQQSELIGQNHRILKSGFHSDGLFVGMWKALERGRTWKGEIKNKAKDGSYYWVDTTIMPVYCEETSSTQYISVRFDITKQKALQEEFKKQSKQLRISNWELIKNNKELKTKKREIEEQAKEVDKAYKYKNEFLARMSHELRTPLNSIILLSRLLSENQNNNLSNQQNEFANVIQRNGQDLLVLIDELLDFSSIESGKMSLVYDTVHLSSVLSNMKEMFSPICQDENIQFSCEIDPTIESLFIHSDQLRLEQILKNLISNAIKFTPKGKIAFRIYANTENSVAFEVKDSGIGIGKDFQETIFDAFTQEDDVNRRKHNGTGLGLSISQNIAKLLGGKILLESNQTKGSCFTLILPIDKIKSLLKSKS